MRAVDGNENGAINLSELEVVLGSCHIKDEAAA